MKLKKAIRILGELNLDRWISLPRHKQAAVDLGIEALKRVEAQRKDKAETYLAFLPGETED